MITIYCEYRSKRRLFKQQPFDLIFFSFCAGSNRKKMISSLGCCIPVRRRNLWSSSRIFDGFIQNRFSSQQQLIFQRDNDPTVKEKSKKKKLLDLLLLYRERYFLCIVCVPFSSLEGNRIEWNKKKKRNKIRGIYMNISPPPSLWFPTDFTDDYQRAFFYFLFFCVTLSEKI